VFRILSTIFHATAALLLTAGAMWADEVVIKDANSGEKIEHTDLAIAIKITSAK
jgi:hypothetical protein